MDGGPEAPEEEREGTTTRGPNGTREGEGWKGLERAPTQRGREKAGGRGLEKAQTQRGLYRIVVSVRNRGAHESPK